MSRCLAARRSGLRDDESFHRIYVTARADLAHSLFNEALDIAHLPAPTFTDDRGTTRLDHSAIAARRLEIDTLQCAAAGLLPKQYSEQVRVDVTADAPLLEEDLIDTARRVAFALSKAAAQTIESTPPVASGEALDQEENEPLN